MNIPLTITFRGMEPSPAVRAEIERKLGKLERFSDRIQNCHVTVQGSHHHHQGNLFHIQIDLSIPGNDLHIHREADKEHAHEDPFVAIRDAFDKAKRQLEDQVRLLRGDVKTRSPLTNPEKEA